MTQISGERHARETLGRLAARSGVSRESIRQAGVIRRRAPELEPRVLSAELSLNVAYRMAIGEQRRPLYLQLDAVLDDQLRAAADYLETSRQTVVRMALAQFLDDGDDEPCPSCGDPWCRTDRGGCP